MPNWCDNVLTVSGPAAETARFRRETSSPDEPLDFDLILPRPPEAAGDWCSTNWGTKWQADLHDLREAPEQIVFRLATAWAPPRGIVLQLGVLYPELQFELGYAEPGNCFAGILRVQDASVEEEEAENDARAAELADQVFGAGYWGWGEDDEDV